MHSKFQFNILNTVLVVSICMRSNHVKLETEKSAYKVCKLMLMNSRIKMLLQELKFLIMAKTAQFFQIKIIIYKRRQKFNPSLILGNTSYNKRWPPIQIEHLQNSLKLVVSAHFLMIFHNIYF